jgi:hypothetical protein
MRAVILLPAEPGLESDGRWDRRVPLYTPNRSSSQAAYTSGRAARTHSAGMPHRNRRGSCPVLRY